MARIIKGKNFLDIFPFYNRDDVVEDPSQDRLKKYHKNDFYPFRPCSFMGLQASCPNNSWEVLRIYLTVTIWNLSTSARMVLGKNLWTE